MNESPSKSSAPDKGLIVGFAVVFVVSVLALSWCFSRAYFGDSERVSSVTMLVGLAAVPVAGVGGLVLVLFAVAAGRKRVALPSLVVVVLGVVSLLALTREEACSIHVNVIIVPDGKGVLHADNRVVGIVPGAYSLRTFEEWLDDEPAPRGAGISEVKFLDTGIGTAKLITSAAADSTPVPRLFYQRGRVSGSVRLSVSDSRGRQTRMSFVSRATLPSGSRILIISFSAKESKL